MLFKSWDLSKRLKLIINGIEMDFSNNFSASAHPTNFSNMIFHEVIPKDKNFYPENLKVQNYAEEFSIGEVYAGDQLIFFGIVNSTGRLNLNPFTPKTKTVEIADFRKWLSIQKPIPLLFFNEFPENLVNTLIEKLNEPKIVVGTLDFSTNELIGAYSTVDKSPYQVLKEVVAKQTNSILYFQINTQQQITINYKSNDTLANDIEPLIIDLNNLDLLKEYKILDIEFESNADKYSNIVKVESSNVIANIVTEEKITILDKDSFTLNNVVGKVSNNIANTYLYKLATPTVKQSAIILNEEFYKEGQYYDVLYKTGNNIIKINKKYLDQDWVLNFGYFIKRKTSVELSNTQEIARIASFSMTKGEVYRYERLNDLTNFNDLLKATESNLEIYKNTERIIYITSEIPLYDILDVVEVVSQENDKVSGLYLVHEINVDINGSSIKDASNNNNFILPVFSTVLKATKNTDNIVNEFDNQNFRDNPVVNQAEISDTTETIILNGKFNLISNIKEVAASLFPNVSFEQAELNYKIYGKNYDVSGIILVINNE